MAIVDSYPLFTVASLAASRDFFVRHFAMTVLFEASWVAMLTSDGESIALGLMSADHPSQPPGPELFEGRGALLTLQVDDAQALGAQLAAAGVELVHPLTDEPWGQRRLMVRDPSGIAIDVVEQIAPAPGFWDAYLS